VGLVSSFDAVTRDCWCLYWARDRRLHKVCGTLYLRSIVNVPSLTPTLRGYGAVLPAASAGQRNRKRRWAIHQHLRQRLRENLVLLEIGRESYYAIWYFIHAYNKSLLRLPLCECTPVGVFQNEGWMGKNNRCYDIYNVACLRLIFMFYNVCTLAYLNIWQVLEPVNREARNVILFSLNCRS